jgi:hypothetical protein
MNAPRNSKIRYTITLEGERDNETAHLHMLRYLLKYLLRARSLKCVDAREVKSDGEGERS